MTGSYIKSPNTAQNFISDLGILKHGVPHESIPRSPLFIMHTHDLLPRSNSVSEPILFADDTARVIISKRNFKDFCSVSNVVLSHMIKWFAANYLVPNLGKI
jgi:hypothetical protein